MKLFRTFKNTIKIYLSFNFEQWTRDRPVVQATNRAIRARTYT